VLKHFIIGWAPKLPSCTQTKLSIIAWFEENPVDPWIDQAIMDLRSGDIAETLGDRG
jgi:hypothetical protein